MALNQWQKISRALAGLPFGSGADGNYSSGTIPTMTYRNCSGSAEGYSLTLGALGYSNGDTLLIHQSRGTGVGQWEINRISTGGGTASLTLTNKLQYTYTYSGSSIAQCVKIPMYINCTATGSTWGVQAWNGYTGGILAVAAKDTFTISSGISANSCGFIGAPCGIFNDFNYKGEGTPAYYYQASNNDPNGDGGGPGRDEVNSNGGGGGGGGNGGAGGTGAQSTSSAGGDGGLAVGSAGLVNMCFGGGGGAAGANNSPDGWRTTGSGGYGGGIIFIAARTFTITGSITETGSTGSGYTGPSDDRRTGAAGGGGGGSCLIQAQTATLGSGLITANGGDGGSAPYGNVGGGGGGGHCALHYSAEYTGTFTVSGGNMGTGGTTGASNGSTGATSYTQDGTLVENVGGYMM